jgi:hypothetical protein
MSLDLKLARSSSELFAVSRDGDDRMTEATKIRLFKG